MISRIISFVCPLFLKETTGGIGTLAIKGTNHGYRHIAPLGSLSFPFFLPPTQDYWYFRVVYLLPEKYDVHF